jgi:aldose 1-epimerase
MKRYRDVAAACVMASCAATGGCSPRPYASLTRTPFGRLSDGHPVELFTLSNGNGIDVRTMPYGATVVAIRTPDRDGRIADIVLGFDRLDGYLNPHPYFGAVVGRYANRIAKGRFTLDGREYDLATNDGPNQLHGGVRGFDKAVWSAEPFERAGNVGIAYTHTSRDGDEGYPGTLTAYVTYTLTPRGQFVVHYEAVSDKATPVNLTQHSYFNLTGDAAGDILDHQLTIDADRFTPVDQSLIPTGELASVAGTPFDFRQPTPIGARINADDRQLRNARGYDHNWVLNRATTALTHAARVADPGSGRTLDVSTTEPGLQFYSGNFLDGTIKGKNGRVYKQRYGFCLETQHFPDSPNHPDFPTTIVRPGVAYRSTTVFAFGVEK